MTLADYPAENETVYAANGNWREQVLMAQADYPGQLSGNQQSVLQLI